MAAVRDLEKMRRVAKERDISDEDCVALELDLSDLNSVRFLHLSYALLGGGWDISDMVKGGRGTWPSNFSAALASLWVSALKWFGGGATWSTIMLCKYVERAADAYTKHDWIRIWRHSLMYA